VALIFFSGVLPDGNRNPSTTSATTLHPELNPSKSEKSLSAFLIDPFPKNTKRATLFPMRETRTAVVSLIPEYPAIIDQGWLRNAANP
jgi:hypothetical protein